MPGYEKSAGAPVLEEPETEDYQPSRMRRGFLLAVIVVAFIAIAFTAAFMTLYGFLARTIWLDNDFVLSNRWMIPVGVIFFSLLVGLCRKYLHAPDEIHGSLVESMNEGGARTDYRTFPGAVCSALCSLLSGASIGPEGTITIMVAQIAAWTRTKVRIVQDSRDDHLGFDMAALASAFNGIIGSPVFTGVLATELQLGEKNTFRFLLWNLVAGLVGYFFYLSLGLASFASMLTYPPLDELTPAMVAWAILMGVVGSLIALFTGLCMTGIGRIMEEHFGERIVLRTLAGGIIIAAVCYFLPALLFSGESQIHVIMEDPAAVGIGMLLLLAILKLILLALSFKSGFMGGPIFPVLFASTMVGLALSLAFPGVPVGIFVLCIEAAAIALALGAPLTAILLVVIVSSPTPSLTALVVTSAVTALILGALLKEMRARRKSDRAAPAAGPA